MEASLEVKSLYFVPGFNAMVGLCYDGTHVVSAKGGEWFTIRSLMERHTAMGLSNSEADAERLRFLDIIKASKTVAVFGAEGQVGTASRT